MARVLRVYKYRIPIIIRYYRTDNHQQRSKCNYYDVLDIPPNATQKEIKEAYIKLSKKMHPDNSTEGSHKHFVKINEAYTILSKSDTRKNYDANLKCNYTYTQPPYKTNSSRRPHFVYEDWGFVDPSKCKPISPSDKQKGLMFCLAIMICGTILQLTFIEKSLVFNRRKMLRKSQKYEAEYNQIKEEAKYRTLEEQLQKIYDLREECLFKIRRN